MPSATEGAIGELTARHSASALHLGGLSDLRSTCVLCSLTMGSGLRAGQDRSPPRTGGVPLLALAAARGEHVFLAARVSQVSPGAVTVAQLLAVAGELRTPSLDGISDLPAGVVHEAVEELIEIGFVRSTPTHTAFRCPVFERP